MFVSRAMAVTIMTLATAMAPAFAADETMEWQFHKSNDAGNKGRMTARLTFGVPETDNIQVTGVCEATRGTGAGSSSLTFGADIGNLEPGKAAEVRFSGGGFDHALKGTVQRAGEEGLNGVQVDVGNDDPLWRAMAEKDGLDYLVPGYKAASLNFKKGKGNIQKFVEACRAYARAPADPQSKDKTAGGGDNAEKSAFEAAKELGTADAWNAFLASYPSGFRADLAHAYIKKLGDSSPAPAAQPPVTAETATGVTHEISCKEQRNVRSKDSNTPAKVTFINVSGMYRSLLWIDFKGNIKDHSGLNDGEQVTVDTFVTHPWIAATGPGNCLQIWMPAPGMSVVRLEGVASEKRAEEKTRKVEKKVTGCDEGFKRVEGKCILKQDAATYCGPGYRLQDNKCVQGYQAPKPQKQLPSWQIEAIKKGCKPGMGWNAAEGCHEND